MFFGMVARLAMLAITHYYTNYHDIQSLSGTLTLYLCQIQIQWSVFIIQNLTAMKIAIPTNDGLTVSSEFGHAKGFLVMSLELGEIIQEEMRWNKLSDIICSSDGIFSIISDCQAVMVENMGPSFLKIAARHNKEIIRTHEPIITNAYIHYLENTLRKETNTCCCP